METEERKKSKPQTDAEVIRSEGKLHKLPDMGTGAEQDHAGKQIQQFYVAEVTLIQHHSEEEAAASAQLRKSLSECFPFILSD